MKLNRAQIEKQMKYGLRTVARLEAMKNNVSPFTVSDDQDNSDLVFSYGSEYRRITVAEMIDAVENGTGPHLVNKVRQYVMELNDMWPTEAAA